MPPQRRMIFTAFSIGISLFTWNNKLATDSEIFTLYSTSLGFNYFRFNPNFKTLLRRIINKKQARFTI